MEPKVKTNSEELEDLNNLLKSKHDLSILEILENDFNIITLKLKNVENETIDKIMVSSGFKMGPFSLMDLIGVDTNYSVTESQYQLFNHEPRFRPSRIQKQKVDAGLHGRKTKEGFYKYE